MATPFDPDDPEQVAELRARQKGRAKVMALVLAGFVILFFFLGIVRIKGGM
jgi:hypothetical protein